MVMGWTAALSPSTLRTRPLKSLSPRKAERPIGHANPGHKEICRTISGICERCRTAISDARSIRFCAPSAVRSSGLGVAPNAPRWQADDFWQYALLAAFANVRAAADPAGVPVREACGALSDKPR